MLGKGFNVAVILGGVELKILPAELAGLPVLIERMLQQIFLGDCGVQPGEQFGVGHEYLQPRGQRSHSRAANCSRFAVTLLARLVTILDAPTIMARLDLRWLAPKKLGAGRMDARDVGANTAEFFYYAFVAAVDVV